MAQETSPESGRPSSERGGVLPSALLLDLDGTLVNSEPLHRAAYRSFFAARGWEYDEATLGLFTGRRAEDVFTAEAGPWVDEEPAALHEEVLSHLDPDQQPDPVAGGAELVVAAHEAGVPLAVVTSAGPEWVEVTVDKLLGIHERFAVVVTAHDVVDGKPHPAGYTLACQRLGADPALAVAVEDSPAGIRAAVAAGVGRVFGITTTWSAEELEAAGASGIVADLRPLRALLQGGGQA